MSDSPFAGPSRTPQHKQCFECGAVLNLADKSCWMCHAEQPLMGKLISSTEAKPQAGGNTWTTKTGIWLGIVVAVIVCYGVLCAGDYVLATVFLVFAVPTLITVMLGSAISRASGRPWGMGTKVGVAAGTMLTTVIVCMVAFAVSVLVLFAMVIAFFQDCFQMLGGQ